MTSTVFWLTNSDKLLLLQPKGIIASKQMNLMLFAVGLMLFVILPSILLAFYLAWKYRNGKNQAYEPELANNSKLIFVMWMVPIVIISILAVVMWRGTHELDPRKEIASTTEPLTIQVVALQWKWLFIYPHQNIATINFVEFPESTPIRFLLTADAPMNSFWIPELGGQMYAMAGMGTELNLMANQIGEFQGRTAELSGQGFAGMTFVAKAVSAEDFQNWVKSAQNSPNISTLPEYEKLAVPSSNVLAALYKIDDDQFYDKIIKKFAPYGHIH